MLSSQEGNLPKKTLMTIITCDNEDNFPTLICNLQERQKIEETEINTVVSKDRMMIEIRMEITNGTS